MPAPACPVCGGCHACPAAPAGAVAVPAEALPSPLPPGPWRVPAGLTACQRTRGLVAISDAGTRDGVLRSVVARLCVEADDALAAAGVDDPTERTKLRAAKVLAYVQACGYRTDPPGQNWWHPVLYTLAHGGTCEALSAATRAGMLLAGVRAQFVWIDQPDARLNHASVQVWYGGEWQWADASVPAALGENPYVAVAARGLATGARADGLG
jgi:hypothetical protein